MRRVFEFVAGPLACCTCRSSTTCGYVSSKPTSPSSSAELFTIDVTAVLPVRAAVRCVVAAPGRDFQRWQPMSRRSSSQARRDEARATHARAMRSAAIACEVVQAGTSSPRHSSGAATACHSAVASASRTAASRYAARVRTRRRSYRVRTMRLFYRTRVRGFNEYSSPIRRVRWSGIVGYRRHSISRRRLIGPDAMARATPRAYSSWTTRSPMSLDCRNASRVGG